MKKLIMSVFLMLFVCGCSSSNNISYEEMLTKMVANAPDEYQTYYESETVDGQEKIAELLIDEFDDYIELDTIKSMIATQSINTFYRHSLNNDVEIALKDIEVSEDSDNHYSFDITYTEDGTEGKFKGKFQTNDEGMVNYFRITTIDLK